MIIIMMISINVKAAVPDCDNKEFVRLKELAKKIEFDYDYELKDGKAVFTINAYNLNKDLQALIIEDYYAEKYKLFKDMGQGEGKLDGFAEGERVVVTIKGYVANWCSGKTIMTKTVKLPYYNKYYDEEKCRGNETFKYCKQLISNSVSEKEFNKQFELYLKNKGKEEEKPILDVTENSSILLIVVIGIIGIVAISIIIRMIIKRKKKNEL